MRIRESVEVAVLLSIGYLLHLVVPPIVLGMKPDLLLGMLFVIILLKRDLKLTIQASIVAGLIAALTTGFPGGQIPNMVDKIVSGLLVLGLVQLANGRLNPRITAAIVGGVGTLISGATFLGTAAILAGLPGSFSLLFTTIVVPATVVNTVAVVLLFPIVEFSRRSVLGKTPQASHN